MKLTEFLSTLNYIIGYDSRDQLTITLLSESEALKAYKQINLLEDARATSITRNNWDSIEWNVTITRINDTNQKETTMNTNVTLAEIKAIKTVIVDGMWDESLLPDANHVRQAIVTRPAGEIVFVGGVEECGLTTVQFLNQDTLYVKTFRDLSDERAAAFVSNRFLALPFFCACGQQVEMFGLCHDCMQKWDDENMSETPLDFSTDGDNDDMDDPFADTAE